MEKSSLVSRESYETHMAECLTEKTEIFSYFQSIGIRTDEIKQNVEKKLLNIRGDKPFIDVR